MGLNEWASLTLKIYDSRYKFMSWYKKFQDYKKKNIEEASIILQQVRTAHMYGMATMWKELALGVI